MLSAAQQYNQSAGSDTQEMLLRLHSLSRYQSRILALTGDVQHNNATCQQFLTDFFLDANKVHLDLAKLRDDIQLRCQIVEQLAGANLVDPDKSLLENLKSSLKGQTRVVIFLANCEHISDTLLKELDELCHVARTLKINVILTSRSWLAADALQHFQYIHGESQVPELISESPDQEAGQTGQGKVANQSRLVAIALISLVSVMLLFSAWSVYQELSNSKDNLTTSLQPQPVAVEPVEEILVADNDTSVSAQPSSLAQSGEEEANGEQQAELELSPEQIIPSDLSAAEVSATTELASKSDSDSATSLPTDVESNVEQLTVEPQPNAVTESTIYGDGAHLLGLPGSHYTLQFSASSTEVRLKQFLASKQALEDTWLYKTRRNDSDWFVAVQGSYASIEAARKAIAELPSEWQNQGVWPKSLAQVQKELENH